MGAAVVMDWSLVVVDNCNLHCAVFGPDEADAPLVVDASALLLCRR